MGQLEATWLHTIAFTGVLVSASSVTGIDMTGPSSDATASTAYYVCADSTVLTCVPGGVPIATLARGVRVTIDSTRADSVCASISGWIFVNEISTPDSEDASVVTIHGADLWDLGKGALSWSTTPPVRIGHVFEGTLLVERDRSPSVVEVRCTGWLPSRSLTTAGAEVGRFRQDYPYRLFGNETTVPSPPSPEGSDPPRNLPPVVGLKDWRKGQVTVERTRSEVRAIHAVIHGPNSNGWRLVSNRADLYDAIAKLIETCSRCGSRRLQWNGRASLEITFADGAMAVLSATDSDMIFYSDNTGHIKELEGVFELCLASQELSDLVWQLARLSQGRPSDQESPGQAAPSGGPHIRAIYR